MAVSALHAAQGWDRQVSGPVGNGIAQLQVSQWASSLALGLSLTARPPRLARELSNPPLQRQMEPSEKMACNGEQEPGWAGLGEASAGQM